MFHHHHQQDQHAAPPGYPPQHQQQYQQQQYQSYDQAGYNTQSNYGGQGDYQPQQVPEKHIAQQHAAPEVSDTGSYQGISYTIKHRNAFSTLDVNLPPGAKIQSIPGAMIHMSATVELQGKIKMSWKRMLTGGQMDESYYTGPGRVALTPTLMGDILNLEIGGGSSGAQARTWMVAKHAYLACTQGVEKDTKSQNVGKALGSGDGLFVYTLLGQGVVWLSAFGAIEAIEVHPGEQHIVDNGHLVAWNCDYRIERAGGGTMNSMKTGEGLVCRFTGPGTVYIQTRNIQDFESWVYDHSAR